MNWLRPPSSEIALDLVIDKLTRYIDIFEYDYVAQDEVEVIERLLNYYLDLRAKCKGWEIIQ